MKIKCKRCKKINNIEWKASGYGLNKMEIKAICPKCKLPYIIYIKFPENDGKEVEIKTEFEDKSYIG